MASGDATAQLVVERRKYNEYDPIRTAKFGLIGLTFVGPALRGWYLTLDRIFGAGGKTTAMKKMIVDQGVFAPAILASFIGLVELSQFRPIEEIKAKYKQDYVTIMKVNWMIWPAVQICNFYFIPLQHRVLVVNMVSYCWNIYLAWKANIRVRSQEL